MITREWPLFPVYGTAAAFFIFERPLLGDLANPWWAAFVMAWLFGVMMLSAFAVVRHSECLAEIFGEPYGTLILTFAITAIEVMMIAAVMLNGPAVSTTARDTMFAVIMIVFNGMAGLTLLVGGPSAFHHTSRGWPSTSVADIGAVGRPWTSSHCLTISLALPGFTVRSALPCQTDTFGHGPLCLEALRTKSPNMSAGRDCDCIIPPSASRTLLAMPNGRPAMMAPPANTSG